MDPVDFSEDQSTVDIPIRASSPVAGRRGTVLMGATPGPSGSYTAFLRLHEGLAVFGWQLIGVSTSRSAWDPTVSHAGCTSLEVAPDDQRMAASRFLELVEEQEAALIIPNNSPGITSAIPHLSTDVGVVMRCNSTTAHAYHFVAAHRDHVHAVVCETPRQMDDLQNRWGIPRDRLRLIPNGVRIPDLPSDAPPSRPGVDELRIVYLGRLHDASKGIFTIPGILRELDRSQVRYRLTLIGSGPDEEELRQRLDHVRPRGVTEFAGAVSQAQVPDELLGADVLLMPSRFEGFGLVCIEGMAAGLAPVVSHLPGVTDSIVDHGETGILCRPGDEKGFASAIAGLARDKAALHRMQAAARNAAQKRFSLASMAKRYDEVFTEALGSPSSSRPEPIPLSDWRPYERYASRRARIMRRVPESLRNRGRALQPRSKNPFGPSR